MLSQLPPFHKSLTFPWPCRRAVSCLCIVYCAMCTVLALSGDGAGSHTRLVWSFWPLSQQVASHSTVEGNVETRARCEDDSTPRYPPPAVPGTFESMVEQSNEPVKG